LRRAAEPGLPLAEVIANWHEIAWALAEPTRKRELQVEFMLSRL